jgi:hypothetical protein
MVKIKQCMVGIFLLLQSTMVYAQETVQRTASRSGVSAIWVLANICYAGMKAQSHPSTGWRVVSFIFGLPGTLISFFVVKEGSERAYGIDIPKKH